MAIPTAAELYKLNALPQSSSSVAPVSSSSVTPAPVSSSSVIPFSSAGSSSSEGPNTVDAVKSSSMAPVEEEKKEVAPAPAKKKVQKKKKSKVSAPKADASVPFGSAEPLPSYPVQPAEVKQESSDDTTDGQPQQLQDVKPMNDPHRTVLQALMGWDDVPFGKRWTHFTQHGFTGMHGDAFNELMALVNSEKDGGSGGTYGQELRAKEQHRRSMLDQWNKLLSEWNSGRYASGDAYTVKEFFNEAERLRQEYANAGYNPNELRRPSINAGGFQQGFQKDLQADRSKLDWIGGWLNDIQQNVARNPNWLNSNQAQMYFDKLSEYVILNMAQSRGAIADAEKVRAQVAAMPRADRLVYDKFMNMFFNANTIAQVEALSNAGNRDAMALLEDMDNFIDLSGDKDGYADIDENGRVTLSKKANNILNAVLLGLGRLQGLANNPLEINTAVTSYKNAKEAFQQYVMQNANVDRQMVWDSAIDQYNRYKNQYNSKLPQLGLNWGWEHKGPTVDENFGNYLAQWQETQPVNDVMRRAKLAVGHPPKPTKDPNAVRGGKGGTHPPDAQYNKQMGKWVKKVNGRWETWDE